MHPDQLALLHAKLDAELTIMQRLAEWMSVAVGNQCQSFLPATDYFADAAAKLKKQPGPDRLNEIAALLDHGEHSLARDLTQLIQAASQWRTHDSDKQ